MAGLSLTRSRRACPLWLHAPGRFLISIACLATVFAFRPAALREFVAQREQAARLQAHDIDARFGEIRAGRRADSAPAAGGFHHADGEEGAAAAQVALVAIALRRPARDVDL